MRAQPNLIMMASVGALAVACSGSGDVDSLFSAQSQPAAAGSGGAAGTGGAAEHAGEAGTGHDGSAGTAQGGGGQAGDAGAAGAAGSAGSGVGGSGGTCAAPTGHDEDADGIDDGCDNCPTYANADQSNEDSDELGDACEAPGFPNAWNRLLYFEPFVSVAPETWTLGDFVPGADELTLTNTSNQGRVAVWNQSLEGRYSVEVNLVYRNDADGYAGVVLGLEQAGGGQRWSACLLNRRGRSSLGFWHYPGHGPGARPVTQEVMDVEPSSPGDLVARKLRVHVVEGEAAVCEFQNALGDRAEVAVNAPQLPPLRGLAGVRVNDALAAFQSFVIYQQ